MRVTLDCARLDSREALHRIVAETLDFPAWYGNNLDALYDCLTDLRETEVHLMHLETLEENLGSYGALFLRVLREAEEENDHLLVTVEE